MIISYHLQDGQPPSSRSGLLRYYRILDRGIHVKTTLDIDDGVMASLEREANTQGRTIDELVEMALRLFLQTRNEQRDVGPLPTFKSGGHLVDIADRQALYRATEED
jgi:hypothetical protein